MQSHNGHSSYGTYAETNSDWDTQTPTGQGGYGTRSDSGPTNMPAGASVTSLLSRPRDWQRLYRGYVLESAAAARGGPTSTTTPTPYLDKTHSQLSTKSGSSAITPILSQAGQHLSSAGTRTVKGVQNILRSKKSMDRERERIRSKARDASGWVAFGDPKKKPAQVLGVSESDLPAGGNKSQTW